MKKQNINKGDTFMRKKLFLLPLCLLTLSVMGCQQSGDNSQQQDQSQQEAQSSAPEKVEFENYSLDQLHQARASKGLDSLDKKYVSIKGKVTFNKRTADDEATLFIQNGKYAIEVNYDKNYQVNVDDVIEIKGQLVYSAEGNMGTIFLSAYNSVNAQYDMKVINEAINVEAVTVTKEADLIEFNGSKVVADFTVVGSRANAAFVGKLAEGDEQIIVAPKLNIAEKVDAGTYVENDNVRYSGVFTYSGDETTKVFRYLDKAGLSKIA